MFGSTYTPFQFMPLGYFTLLSIKWLCALSIHQARMEISQWIISFSSCFLIHSALFFNPSKLYKMKLRSVFKNKPGNLTEVNILQWHKVHSGMITSEETFWAPKHINRFFLMKSQHCPKDIYFRFIVTLRNDIPIFVVYTMMRKSFSFCYFFRFKIWVTM